MTKFCHAWKWKSKLFLNKNVLSGIHHCFPSLKLQLGKSQAILLRETIDGILWYGDAQKLETNLVIVTYKEESIPWLVYVPAKSMQLFCVHAYV